MGQTWILAVSGDVDRHGVERAGNRDALSPSTRSKEHPGERETPHKTVEECTVDPVSILSAKEPAPCTLQGAPTGCLCTASLCKGGVSKNNSMLSPKLLLCLPLCHKLHVTSHSRESVRSVMLGHPDETTKTEFRGIESFPVCPMTRPPTSFQLSRLCHSNPPASQGSPRAVS